MSQLNQSMDLPEPPSRTLLVVQAGISNLVDNKLVADPRKGQIEICLVSCITFP